ncbi:mandelate racemase/muconate lactonizing enzyme family protein [Herbiconiux daphne]|uniref:Mandelate racemase/muconate lactonizing enzyme family protein n=1 Tax=Herbiconiux daphne TaxID=2970914 RepID=A0ABT2H6B2_9MICO|nr:mandelate racemase/muconate lactonizing enzyme family protein [Herbiconiux daphne]MCS5735438.1 mandelate racemase/muconate lactonizing enzyme family protein [Herbiconiux daphne]
MTHVRIRSITPLPLRMTTDYSSMTYFTVKIETDDGLVGWGESCDCFGISYPSILQAFVDDVYAPAVVGRELGEARSALDDVHRATRRTLGDQFSASQSRSAIDIALRDLEGRASGTSLSNTLGRVKDSVRIYAGNSHFLDSQEAPDHLAMLAPLLDRGVSIVKLRIGSDWRNSLRVLRELRRELDRIDETIEITVDGSELFTVAESIEIAARLGDLRVGWFEEPVQSYRLGAIAQVVRASPVPVAYGEHFFGTEYALDALELTGISVIQPDASICGGVDEARMLARTALLRGARVVMHLHGGPISFAANLHVAASVAGVEVIEYPFHLSPVMNRVAADAGFGIDAIVDGRIAVPSGPGLGIAVDESVIEEAHRAWLA